VHADLFAHEGGFSPRPAWQVIEAARRQGVTGELALATAPTTTVFLRDGRVYFAERATDTALGVRLLVAGALDRQQLSRGAILLGGVEHLGRLFDRDPSIDRATVELAVESMTDEALVAAAHETVAGYRMTMYRRHPSGIDRWQPAGPITGPEDATDQTVDQAPVAPPVAAAPVAEHEPVIAAPEPAPVVPVFSAPEPVWSAPVDTATSMVDAIATSGLASEVAEAIRNALMAIEAAAQPEIPLLPSDIIEAQPAFAPLTARVAPV
jgi:hypothetical protein